MQAYRAAILHCLAFPSQDNAVEYFPDGILLVEQGRVISVGPASTLLPQLSADIPVHYYPDALITPGFIDCHVHFPQVDNIASYGEQLLQWLEKYTFPAEMRFADEIYAANVAEFFIQQLLRNGTTSAAIYPTVHLASVNALFTAALSKNMRIASGKVLMDRFAPIELLDTPATAYQQSKALIQQWHGKGRLQYAVTPRFAITSSPEQLTVASQLLQEYPDVLLQTHLAENTQEIAEVKKIFPHCQDYTQVYQHYGLVTARSLFAHAIHLHDSELCTLAHAGSAIAFCPLSNNFMGSGLFNYVRTRDAGVTVGLGTDVGAGDNFSLLTTINEAYKVTQLHQHKLSPLEAFYLATLGGAKALHMDNVVGNFAPGKEADFIVLDYHATELLAYRQRQATTLEDKLFLLEMLGDDRVIQATYIAGVRQYQRNLVV
jgi:guanine deaminase